ARLRKIVAELKRRRVFRVGLAYAGVVFVVWQVAEIAFPALGLPDWALTLVVVVSLLGFPIALVLAWAYDVTPEGVRRTPGAPESDGGRAAFRTEWRPVVLATVVIAAVAAGWLGWQLLGTSSDGEVALSSSTVAVLPFAFRGSDELAYLGEGMVSLLTTKLDGAGDLRSVDSRALLSHLEQVGETADPEAGEAVARRFGAGLYVMGDIVEVSGQITINAALYPSGGDAAPVVDATVEGPADRVFNLVDELTARLLAAIPTGLDPRTTRTAALTTSSLPALKAYLEGESALRGGDYRAAVEAFTRAVEHDTTFALGYYRLSIAAEWRTELETMVQASEQALRYSDGLNERYRRLLTAFRAFRRGENQRAEDLYRSILSTYPDDVEAWLYLAEGLFHTNPYRGEPISAAWDPYARAVEYEPGNAASLVHMIRIAATRGRPRAVDTLVARYASLNPDGDRMLPVRALHATVRGDETAWGEVVSGLAESSGATVAVAVWDVGTYGQDLRRAGELARLLTSPSRPIDERSIGFQWVAVTLAARGQWDAAERELVALEDVNPAAAAETRALLYLAPYAPVSRDELRRARDRLAALDASAVPSSGNPSLFFSAHDGLFPIIRAYLVGRLSARIGELDGAGARAGELRASTVPVPAGPLADDLARELRVRLALERTDSAAALAGTQTARQVVYNYAIVSPYYAGVFDRFLRAELLGAMGRDREALKWYEHLASTSTGEMLLVPAAHLGQARIHERLGNRAAAAAHYDAFLELWRDADPTLRPMVEQAREARARLVVPEP
ncbi:MAG: tetratricopeptide repeat protein, partial [Longimicrobiales bacterium]|nr:tetratricopeptide repeat protein [Longimicrobiales bacterium]